MTHFFMIHTHYGFEMEVFDTMTAAEAEIDRLRRFTAYRELQIDVIRIEPNIETAIVSRSYPKD
jgi:hypothetical protein